MDLLVNVAQLLKEQAGATHTIDLDGPELEIDGAEPAFVRGRIVLTRTDIGIWASGDIAISADATCSRCLVPVTSSLDVRVDDIFLPRVDLVTGAKIDPTLDPDADTASIDVYPVLDLTNTLREYRLAAMPLAPLCREECQGICPQCGTDRNQTTCSCEPEPDPRWAKLRELLT